MRVAALYDVHGMPWALEAVLAEAEAEADAIVVGGDFTYGPCSREVLERVRALDVAAIRGNCEREPDTWERATLEPEQIDWMRALPATVELDGVLYCHATPTDDLRHTYYSSSDDTIAANFAGVAGTVVIGHTHHQFDRRVRGVRVVNAGAVGMPYEGVVGAAFWVLLVDGEPEFRSTPFDVEEAIERVRASGWPQAESFVRDDLERGITRDEAIAEWERGP
jgi:putative phosphoesterase